MLSRVYAYMCIQCSQMGLNGGSVYCMLKHVGGLSQSNLPESLMKKPTSRRPSLKLTKQTLKTLSANHLRQVEGGTVIQAQPQQMQAGLATAPPKETYVDCYTL